MSSYKVPESGLSVQVESNTSSSFVTPQRTHAGIQGPSSTDSRPDGAQAPVSTPMIIKEADKTKEQFQALADAAPSGTGHPIGRYHNFFHELLTWKQPRASAVILAFLQGLILLFRFVNVPRIAFRFFGIGFLASTVVETLATQWPIKAKRPFVRQFGPRKYYGVARESLDSVFTEVHSLVNFFVQETQRLLFAEDLTHTRAAAVACFAAYFALKFIPFWVFLIIGNFVMFSAPYVYYRNQKNIDQKIEQVAHIKDQLINDTTNVIQHQATVVSEKTKAAAINLGDKTGVVDARKYLGEPNPNFVGSVASNDLTSMPPRENAPTKDLSTLANEKYENTKEAVSNTYEDAKSTANQKIEDTKAAANDAYYNANQKIEETKQAASETYQNAKDTTNQKIEESKAVANEKIEDTKQGLQNASASAQQGLQNASATAQQSYQDAKVSANQNYQETRADLNAGNQTYGLSGVAPADPNAFKTSNHASPAFSEPQQTGIAVQSNNPYTQTSYGQAPEFQGISQSQGFKASDKGLAGLGAAI